MTYYMYFLQTLVIRCTINETQPLERSVTLIWPLKVIQGQRSQGQLKDHTWLCICTSYKHWSQHAPFLFCWSLTSLCHSNGHIETMQPEKLIPLLPWPGFDPSFSGHNDRRAITASGHDYALDHSAIEAGCTVSEILA